MENLNKSVLIFRNVRDIYYQEKEDFIEGIIVGYKKENDLLIYKILGNDGIVYYGAYNKIVMGYDFIITIDDYIVKLVNTINDNRIKINKLKMMDNNKYDLMYLVNINNKCLKTIDNLYEMKNEFNKKNK